MTSIKVHVSFDIGSHESSQLEFPTIISSQF